MRPEVAQLYPAIARHESPCGERLVEEVLITCGTRIGAPEARKRHLRSLKIAIKIYKGHLEHVANLAWDHGFSQQPALVDAAVLVLERCHVNIGLDMRLHHYSIGLAVDLSLS